MNRRAKGIFLMCLVMVCAMPLAVSAKPTAPVAIEYSVPKNVQTGDEVSTTIRVVAQADLEGLKISVSPYEGLVLLSNKEEASFLTIKRGEAREFEVTIQLTDPEVGYLSVFATTITTTDTRTKSIAIRYGTAGPEKNQKLRSNNLVKTQKGEDLILLPGDPR